MPVMPFRQLSEAGYFGSTKWARGDYSFAADGGAVGNINLGTSVPSGALVLSAYMEVTAAVTGAGASVALQIESAGDVQAAAAISGAPWSTTGLKLSSARTRAAVPLKTTADRDIVAVVSAAVITAGAFRVYVEYIEAP